MTSVGTLQTRLFTKETGPTLATQELIFNTVGCFTCSNNLFVANNLKSWKIGLFHQIFLVFIKSHNLKMSCIMMQKYSQSHIGVCNFKLMKC